MSDLDDPVYQGGQFTAGLVAGLLSWVRGVLRGRSKEVQGGSGGKKPNDSVDHSDKLECYLAFVRGMSNRRMTYVALRLVRRADMAMSAYEVGEQTQALAPDKWAPGGIEKVITALVAGGFIEPTQMDRHYRSRPIADTLLIDFDSMQEGVECTSEIEDRLACFEGILRWARKSNTFQYVLTVLMLADHPMSAEEVFFAARQMSGKEIQQHGVEKLLRDLTVDPFVVETNDESYVLHKNGRTLLESMSGQRP